MAVAKEQIRQIMCPGTAMGSLSQSSFRNTSGMSLANPMHQDADTS